MTYPIDDPTISDIVGKLVRVKKTRRGAVISTPVLFPSGAHVTVTVSMNGRKCLITDDGSAYSEADMMGAGETFKRVAKTLADQANIRFNSYELFEANALPEHAAGMIAIVADTARRAVQLTSERIIKRPEADTKAIVIDQLRSIFGHPAVAVDAPLSGSSTHEWTVDALVTVPDGRLAIEAVSPAPVSVSSAYMKMDDIRRIEGGGPTTIVAIQKAELFGSDQLLMLGRTSRILEVKRGPLEIRRLVAA